MPEDRYKLARNIHQNPGDAIEGDNVLIYCRKPGRKWISVRGSKSHNYFKTTASKNALAILERKFKNLQKA